MQLSKPLSPNAANLTRRQFCDDFKSIFVESRNNSLSTTNNIRLLFGRIWLTTMGHFLIRTQRFQCINISINTDIVSNSFTALLSSVRLHFLLQPSPCAHSAWFFRGRIFLICQYRKFIPRLPSLLPSALRIDIALNFVLIITKKPDMEKSRWFFFLKNMLQIGSFNN